MSARVFWLMHARAAKQRLLPASGQGCVNALVGEFTSHDAKGLLRPCACCGPNAVLSVRFGIGMVSAQIVWCLVIFMLKLHAVRAASSMNLRNFCGEQGSAC